MNTSIFVAWGILGLALLRSFFWLSPLSFGFAQVLAAAVWLAGAVYAWERRYYPSLHWGWAWLAGLLGALVLLLLFPGTPLHAQSTPWLPLHWAAGILSYTMFALAVGHAWMLARREAALRSAGARDIANRGDGAEMGPALLTIERLMFNFIFAGFVLLSITLVLGWGFRDYLYGHHSVWAWDHKSVFSALSWLFFLTLLAGRYWLGWRGRKAVRVLYAGALFLLLAYVGTHFVLEVFLQRPAK